MRITYTLSKITIPVNHNPLDVSVYREEITKRRFIQRNITLQMECKTQMNELDLFMFLYR